MKLGTAIFAAFVLIAVGCFAYPFAESVRAVRRAYLESAEEPLVDTAVVLAEIVGASLATSDRHDEVEVELDVEPMYDLASRVRSRALSARIYRTVKSRVDLDVYVTDAHGRVVFDTRPRSAVGQDYSGWRDVRRTLAGEYGARVGNPEEPLVFYVAAPIRVDDRIVGSLTVVKPTTAVAIFLARTRPRLVAICLIAAVAAIFLMWLVSGWVRQQVGRLTAYADAVREGERVPFPSLAPTELHHMGLAFERMRESLAGQTYVASYVGALTHEIKSPISAIRGAAELLASADLDEPRRQRLFTNLQDETRRIEDLVDRMLVLSELESRRALPEATTVALASVVRTIADSLEPATVPRGVQVVVDVPEDATVVGDPFLVHLALSNLIKNAIEWSPRGGIVRVLVETTDDATRIVVDDEGPGIPDYARDRIFERFYSLERPESGRKSTGLGLNFVREVAALHHGTAALSARDVGGTRATITIGRPGPSD